MKKNEEEISALSSDIESVKIYIAVVNHMSLELANNCDQFQKEPLPITLHHKEELENSRSVVNSELMVVVHRNVVTLFCFDHLSGRLSHHGLVHSAFYLLESYDCVGRRNITELGNIKYRLIYK